MSFTVHLIKMAKKPNSTKQPTYDSENGYGGVVAECTLRGPCGVVSPVLEFHSRTANGELLDRYNYCYIPNFNRFYFIDEWVYDGPIRTAYCKCDVLASFKTTIGASKQFVLRSESAFDKFILDTMYPATTDIERICKTSKPYDGFAGDMLSGTFAVTVATSAVADANLVPTGGMATYLFDALGMKTLLDYLYSTTDWLSITDVTAEMTKALINPMQYIKSCRFYPTKFTHIVNKGVGKALGNVPVKLGWWSFDTIENARILSGLDYIYEDWFCNFIIESHPQAFERGAYLNATPYSRHTITIPYHGEYTFSSAVLQNYAVINVKLTVDMLNGEAFYTIYGSESGDFTEDEHLITRISVNIGTELGLTQYTTDVLGAGVAAVDAIGGVVGSALSIMGGGSVASGVSSGAYSLLSGLASAVTCATPQSVSIGCNGSVLESKKDALYSVEFFKITDACDEKYGRPLCKYISINELQGFIMCRNSSLEIDGAVAQENEAIVKYMDGGFYYE